MKIYALLVGINIYSRDQNGYPKLSPLYGCENDVRDIKAFLETQYGAENINIKTLINHQATRKAIMEQFVSHLGQAKADDIAYFHFSGHGAQEDAPEAFYPIEPSKKNETLVCYDSRNDGQYDLADKELAVLIAKVAEKNPHILIILDACHSGSATRDDNEFIVRRTSIKGRSREIEFYANGYYTRKENQDENGNIQMPLGKHIVFSACRPEESATENGKGRASNGLFTATLVEALKSSEGNISYGDLIEKIQIHIRKTRRKQRPLVNVYEGESVWKQFMTGKAMSNTRKVWKAFFDRNDKSWYLNGGALHGLPLINEKNPQNIDVQLHKIDDNGKITSSIKAIIEKTFLQTTRLKLDLYSGFFYKSAIYQATLAAIPELLYVYSEVQPVDNEGNFILIESILPSGYYAITSEKQAADYLLLNNLLNIYQFDVIHNASNKLVAISNDNDADFLENIFLKIARWENLRVLNNPYTSMDTHKVKIKLNTQQNHEPENQHTQTRKENPIIIPITERGERVPYSIDVNNTTNEDLYITILLVSPLYGILLFKQQKVAKATKFKGRRTNFVFMRGQEAEQESDLLYKFIITREPIDTGRLVQSNFDLEAMRSKTRMDDITEGEQTRGMEKSDALKDWYTMDLFVKLIRTEQTLKQSRNPYDLEFVPPNGIDGKIGFGSLMNSSRGLRDYTKEDWTDWLRGHDTKAALLNLSPITRGMTTIDVITLENIENGALVNDTNPLKIKFPTVVKESEAIIALTLDDQTLIPIGYSNVDNRQVIEITSLPSTLGHARHTRSILRALSMCFFKVVLKQPSDTYFKLRAVTVTFKGHVIYIKNDIKERVRKAKRILLLIHGIIGNTENIATFAHSAWNANNDNLILAFDYENLNTPIDEIALELKTRLISIGINSHKKITVLAHSMGGLVARYLVEQRHGHQFVERLIMCGTPNGGSIFGELETVLRLANIGIGLGVNLLSSFNIVISGLQLISTIQSILDKSGTITVALAQMQKDSTFLRDLNEEGHSGNIPYYIIAGDVQKYKPENISFWQKVIELTYRKVGNLFNQNQPNDIAVLVEDIKESGQNKDVELFDVPCHHMNYFTQQDSKTQLYKILE